MASLFRKFLWRSRERLTAIPLGIKERYFQKYFFIHINKTAGTSVTRALRIRFRHQTACEVIEIWGRKEWDSRFTFAFVRNPWDRVVSNYHYRTKLNEDGLGDNPIPFREWVERVYVDQDPAYHVTPKFFIPQVDWLVDSDGKTAVEFVGRFERLSDDFAEVCRRLGTDTRLPHLKQIKRKDYRTFYDDKTAEIVSDWYARDIETFGYAFDET